MMTYELPSTMVVALNLVNFALCSLIGLACVCRISVMTERTVHLHFRVGYSMLLGAATFSGWEWAVYWLWRAIDMPINPFAPVAGLGQIMLAASALYVLGNGAQNWAGGPPDYARTDRGDLDTLPSERWAELGGGTAPPTHPKG